MLARTHRLATRVWLALAMGAGLGFLARDVLGVGRPLVALAWVAGATTGGLAPDIRPTGPPRRSPAPPRRAAAAPRCAASPPRRPAAPPRSPPGEDGQATVEWVGLVLLASLALGALGAVAVRADGWSLGGFLAGRLACAPAGGCRDGQRALVRAYGPRTAALVRASAPGLVYERGERELAVDWRRCRRPACANAPDEPDLDVHRSDAGVRAAAFTRVLRRGRRLYLEYWLYYPDSNTTWAGSDWLWRAAWLPLHYGHVVRRTPRYPGFHRDDWEGYVVRIDPDGRAWARATSHGGWRSCKERYCAGDWARATGWTRVSRGSHAGHIPLQTRLIAHRRGHHALPRVRRVQTPLLPGPDLHERTTSGDGLRLIPLETLDTDRYRRHGEDVTPPWEKEAYEDPTSDSS